MQECVFLAGTACLLALAPAKKGGTNPLEQLSGLLREATLRRVREDEGRAFGYRSFSGWYFVSPAVEIPKISGQGSEGFRLF